ncbi:MAG: response regulator transcription factor [Chloroflexi bacterium]|nr:MAG: response regulator transcription factor [Chloroflexota bacterium]
MNNVVKKILIAEDESTLVLTLKYNLEREGYAVVIATDGEAAVATAHETRPDLIVLDVMMPRLSGIEVCRILRKEIDVPILILSARADETEKAQGLEAGANDYVIKPFGMSQLMTRIRSLLGPSEHVPPADH